MSTPFCLCIARPDYKRPYVQHIFGSNVTQVRSELHTMFYSRIKHVSDVTFEEHIDGYWNYGYMNCEPYELKIFNNETNQWDDVSDIVQEVYDETRKEVMEEIEEEENQIEESEEDR